MEMQMNEGIAGH